MPWSRRQFLRSSVAATALSGVWSSRATASSDVADIRVGLIGFRGQGARHFSNIRGNVVALCDADQQVLSERGEQFSTEVGRKLDAFTDFRRLLDRDDIDAVSIATPNHTHSLIAIAAAQAGKDVYVEKPISHNIWEGRQLVAAARKYGRVIQCGIQSRSSKSIAEAVEYVQAGELGAIKHVLGVCYKPRKSIGKLDAPLPIPASVNYDLWCGPAEMRKLYRPQLHYDWHWDFNTGGGDLGNQGVHQLDVARWFLGEPGLAPKVVSIGARLGYADAADTPNTMITLHSYPTAPLLFEVRGLPRAKEFQTSARWGKGMDVYRGNSVGVIVQCERGYVMIPAFEYNAAVFDQEGRPVLVGKGKGYRKHHRNWLDSVAARDAARLNAEAQEGHVSSALCHAGNISCRLGSKVSAPEIADRIRSDELLATSFDRMASHLRANDIDIDSKAVLTMGPTLEIDPTTETFTNSDKANELRIRQGRAPFTVPDLGA